MSQCNLVARDHDGCAVDPNYFNEDRRLKMLTEDISTQLEEKKTDSSKFMKIHNNFKITILSENPHGHPYQTVLEVILIERGTVTLILRLLSRLTVLF